MPKITDQIYIDSFDSNIASILYAVAYFRREDTTNKPSNFIDFGDKQYLVLSLVWLFNAGLWICII